MRSATADDIPAVCALERRAGEPFRSVGLSAIADDELGPDLRRIRDAEQAAGLDVSPRVAMRRTV